MENTDLYIKDEGYADCRVATLKLKKFLNKHKVYNSWEKVDKMRAYSSKNPNGLFSFQLKTINGNLAPTSKKIIKLLKNEEFKIESEF